MSRKLRDAAAQLSAGKAIGDLTTAGNFCRRFRQEHLDALQEAIDGTRCNVWATQPASFFKQANLDGDGTMVTKCYGPHVEGAGVHHNPTPGPADQMFVCGHVWATLSCIVHHPWWGTIGLTLLAKLYARAKGVWLLSALYGWNFQTKLELAVELVEWAVRCQRWLKLSVWVVEDGRNVKRPFLHRALAAGAVVGRLRKDTALFSVPKPATKKGRGRPRKYGPERVSRAKRASARGGWQTEPSDLYHKFTMKTYKTLLATYPPVGGLLRVVLVREERRWFAWFCTDPNASVREILETVTDRAANKQHYHDLEEVHGAGQQQLRSMWADIGSFNLLLWLLPSSSSGPETFRTKNFAIGADRRGTTPRIGLLTRTAVKHCDERASPKIYRDSRSSDLLHEKSKPASNA